MNVHKIERYTVEQLLLAVESERGFNQRFVSATMDALRKQAAQKTSDELFLNQGNPTKRTIFYRLSHLPKLAVVLLVVLALTVLSGTAYAAYRLWIKPVATVENTVNIQNHVQALISVKNCGSQKDLQVKSMLDPSSGLSANDAAKVVQAYCEMGAIGQWAANDLGLQDWAAERFEHTHGDPVVFAYRITAIRASHIEVQDNSGKYQHIALNKHTVFVADAEKVTKNKLKPGDTITFIVANPHYPQDYPTLAVIKLDLPTAYYDSSYQQHIRTSRQCEGNLEDICVGPPWQTVYQATQDERVRPPKDDQEDMKQLQGKVKDIQTEAFTIETSSGRTVVIHAVSVIHSYNAADKQFRITTGDTLNLEYQGNAKVSQLNADQIVEIGLLVRGVSQDDMHKY